MLTAAIVQKLPRGIRRRPMSRDGEQSEEPDRCVSVGLFRNSVWLAHDHGEHVAGGEDE